MIEAMKDEYFLVSVCFPGNEKNGKPKAWGYTIPEIVEMLENTINSLPNVTQPFTIISHDWGAAVGYLYENRYPHKVRRMVALDIGLNIEPQFRIFLYQLWFAATYIVTQLFGLFIGKIPFWTIFILFEIFPFLSPLGLKGDAPKRPRSDLRPDMCYPYYQIWKHVLSQKLSDIIALSDKLFYWGMPTCPLLFLVCFLLNIFGPSPLSCTAVRKEEERHVPREEVLGEHLEEDAPRQVLEIRRDRCWSLDDAPESGRGDGGGAVLHPLNRSTEVIDPSA
jgi:pimeloyl-ACP methyl ester carboxylesterase